jgi:hypothetical protein
MEMLKKGQIPNNLYNSKLEEVKEEEDIAIQFETG